MTTEEIIRMARMAGIDSVQQYDSDTSPIVLIERFATLVASAEREACIELVAFYGGPVDLEAAIRARGQA